MSNPELNLPEMMTVKELAALLRVPVSTLYAWRVSGTDGPPSFRLGGSVRYLKTDVSDWLSSLTTARKLPGDPGRVEVLERIDLQLASPNRELISLSRSQAEWIAELFNRHEGA